MVMMSSAFRSNVERPRMSSARTPRQVMLYDEAFTDDELRDHLGIDTYKLNNDDFQGTDKLHNPPDMAVVDPGSNEVKKKPLSAWMDGASYDDPPSKSWNEFFQETTFHGVKYIFEDTPFKYRRITWGVVVVVAIALFAWQVGERINTYFKYQTTVDVEVIYTQTMDFPAVTICNQNNFRQSVAVDMDLYHFIDKLYSSHNYSGMDFSQYNLNINADDFAKKTAHQLEDFVDSCKWHSKPCDMSRDFTTTLTDIGVCYTFNGQPDPRQVKESGAGSGLSLVLNVEQYEYMRGPQNDAGVKILLHSYGETPLMKDMGFAAAPGTHTLVSVYRHEAISMPYPYGHCLPGGQPMPNCLTQCKTKYILRECLCRDVYMPDVNITEMNASDNDTIQVSYPICSLTEKYKCVERYIEELTQMESVCECPVACDRVKFSPSLSYAHLSRFNVDRLVLTDPQRKVIVKEQFLKAREISQRTIMDIAEHDEELMSTIVSLGQSLKNTLKTVKPKMTSIGSFANALGFPNVMDGGMVAIQADYNKLIERMGDLHWQLEGVLGWLSGTHKLQENLKTLLDIQGNSSATVEKLLACIPGTTPQATVGTAETTTEMSAVQTTETSTTEAGDDGSGSGMVDMDTLGMGFFYPIIDMHFPGGFDPFEFHDPVEGLSPECSELFYQVQQSVQCLGHSYPRPNEELQDLPTAYEEFATALFPNSTDAIPGHMACTNSLIYLSDTYAPHAQEITDILDEVSSNMGSIQDMADGIQKLFEATERSNFLGHAHWSFDYEESWGEPGCQEFHDANSGMITNCSYPLSLATSFNDIFENMYDLLYSQEAMTIVQAMNNAEVGFSDASVAIRKLYENVNQKLVPILDHLQNYLKGNTTKQSLFDRFDSVAVQEMFSELATQKAQLDSGLRDFINNMKAMDQFIIDGYRLFMDTPVPAIHAGNIFTLNMYDDIKTMNGTYLAELKNATTDDFAKVAADILVETFEGYVLYATEIRANITPILQDLTLHMDILKKEIAAFGEGSEMSDDFYMNNFLQVDIFYGELKYQKVEQMPAFELLSLFSEVGGFLGLLLGASIITICELIDYITIAILKRCHKKRAVGPDAVIIKKPLH